MSRPRAVTLFALVALTTGSVPATAQNHPELEWHVLESEHFRVLFHTGLGDADADVTPSAASPPR